MGLGDLRPRTGPQTADHTMAERYAMAPTTSTSRCRTRHGSRYFADESSASRAAEGAGKGGGIGMGVGAALGAIVATATAISVPGLGLIVAGPIAGAIAGAGTGAAAGTVLGAMVGATIPKDRDRRLREGRAGRRRRDVGACARRGSHAAELEQEMSSHGGRLRSSARRISPSNRGRKRHRAPRLVGVIASPTWQRPATRRCR